MKKICIKFYYIFILIVVSSIGFGCRKANLSTGVFSDIYKHYNNIYTVTVSNDMMYFVGNNDNSRSVGIANLLTEHVIYDIYDLAINTRVVDFAVNNDNKLVLLLYTIKADDLSNITNIEDSLELYELVTIDNRGNIESSFELKNIIDLSIAKGFYDIEVDKNNNLYLVDYNGDIWFVGKDYNVLFKIDNEDSYIKGIGSDSNGSMAVFTTQDEDNYLINLIDINQQSYGKSYGYIDNMKDVDKFTRGVNSGITFVKDNVLYNYSFINNKKVELFRFTKEHINTVAAITLLTDERYVIINSIYDYDTDALKYNSIYVDLK